MDAQERAADVGHEALKVLVDTIRDDSADDMAKVLAASHILAIAGALPPEDTINAND